MEHVLLVIHVLIAVGLIGAVLLQRSDTDGFGLGSGSGSNFMTGRAAASMMTRTTAILATLFILNSLALGIIAARGGDDSIVTTITEEQDAEPQVPLAVGKDEETGATEATINRDEAMDTDAAAKKASNKKAEEAPTTQDADAPAVPEAQ